MHVRTMEEMEALSDDDYIDLVPDDFLRDEEDYLRRRATQHYHRFVNVVIFTIECMIPLTDGSKWHFHNTEYHYEPLHVRGANN